MLSFNPQREEPERLNNLTRGRSRFALLYTLTRALEQDVGAELHQHHLLVGPRGMGKTHLLRVLVHSRLAEQPELQRAYWPIVLPEETAVRTVADLPLRLVEALEADLRATTGEPPEGVDQARAACLDALQASRHQRDPLLRARRCFDALEGAAASLDRTLLAVVENMDSLLYTRRGSKQREQQQWALRTRLQESSHLLLLASAVSRFGAIDDEGAAFTDFFSVHRLDELGQDEVLDIVAARLEEAARSHPRERARARAADLLKHFDEVSPKVRGVLLLAGGLPRFAHLVCEVLLEVDVSEILGMLEGFLDELTPYFQQRLDPRLLPEAEIDVLYTLASAWGPLRPAELAEQLYGVPANEVSALLGRLEERGLVGRKDVLSQRNVTWDLTEPLYRVWIHFRSGTGERFTILAELVASLYSREELDEDRLLLEAQHEEAEDPVLRANLKRSIALKKLALERCQEEPGLVSDEELSVARAVVEEGLPGMLAEGLQREMSKHWREEEVGGRQEQLEELRSLYLRYSDDSEVRRVLARCLELETYSLGERSSTEQQDAVLAELRELSESWPEDLRVRWRRVDAVLGEACRALRERDRERFEALFDEGRGLHQDREDLHTNKQYAFVLVEAVSRARDEGALDEAERYLKELIDVGQGQFMPRHLQGLLTFILHELGGGVLRRFLTTRMAKASPKATARYRPYLLAAAVDEEGESALAGEPEEMRRVVRLLLERASR